MLQNQLQSVYDWLEKAQSQLTESKRQQYTLQEELSMTKQKYTDLMAMHDDSQKSLIEAL